MIEGIKEEARAQDEAEEAAKRSAGRSDMRSWDCSQIEEEEEEVSWREEDQMAAQWVEEQKMEEILERRRMEGCSWQLEIMQKAPELLVRERMSQGQGVKGHKDKKKVPGWSVEEMKESQVLCG